jgi:ribokinase
MAQNKIWYICDIPVAVNLVKVVVRGAINWDISLFVKRFPKRGEEVVVQRIARVPGGKGGNVAVAASRLLWPNQTAILGGLGMDSIGSQQVGIFEKEGVVTSGIKFTENAESGQAYILIDEHGENMIQTYRGANSMLTPEDLDEPNRHELISQAAFVTIMDPPLPTALKLAVLSKSVGKTVAWDPGVKSQLGLAKVKDLIKNVDYVVANQSEIENLTGTKDYRRASRKLRTANADLKVIAKRGPRGSVMFRGKDRIVSKPLDLKAKGMVVVNTVGCGDAFLGAFVAALSEGRPDLEALKWANVAGSLKATRSETRGSPDRETLLKHLQ